MGIYPNGATPRSGIYDLAGNAWEWCEDGLEYRAWAELDGEGGAREGRHRVLRGGSFRFVPPFIEGARRYRPQGFRGDDLGFRVAWEA